MCRAVLHQFWVMWSSWKTGRFRVVTSVASRLGWCTANVAEHAGRMDVEPAAVKIRDLGYHLGSCGKGRRLYFPLKAILLLRSIAQYVVVPELVHLHTPHHTPEFWQRLERAMPDYERRKQWLAAHGMNVEGL